MKHSGRSLHWVWFVELAVLSGLFEATAQAATEIWHLTATNITGVANGGTVSNWPSSAGPNATQATSANRPLWYNSDANLPNGRPVVRFVRSSSHSMQADFTSSYAQPLTFFVVAYIRPVSDGNMFIFDSVTGANRLCLYQPTDNNKLDMYTGGDFVGTTSFTNRWIIYEAQFNGASSVMYTNGTQSGSGNAGTGGISAADDLRIGRRYTSEFFMDADIAEIIAYQGTLTSGERDMIGNNLGAFYGIATKYAGPLAAAFSATPTNGPAPQSVTFTDFSTGIPSAWSWSFGDGGVSTLQNPTHTYATGGTYDVTLTVTNAFGSNTLTRTGCIVLTNPPPPVAGFSANITTGTYPVVVTFTNQSSGQVNSSLWDFGDGSNSVAQNPLHLYTTSGVYTVSLTVGNPGGSNTMTRSGYITVTPGPAGGKPLEFRADALVGLTNGQFMSLWTDTSGNGRDVRQGNAARKPFYATNRVNGLPAVQFRSQYTVYGNCLTNTGYSIAQPYTIFMVARSDGDNGANTVDVFLDGYPGSANRIFIALSWSGGAQANFYTWAGGAGPLSFPWTQVSWSNWHLYEMKFDGTNSAVWVDGSFKATANVGTWPLAGMTLGDHQAYNTGLNGEMAEFVVYGGALSSTNRYELGSALCSKYGLAHSYSPPASPLAAEFSALPTNAPAPQTVTFSDLSTGGPTNWSWTFGDGGVSALAGPVHTYPTAGVYTVRLVVSGTGGVSTNTKVGYIVITNPPPPVADFTGTPVTGAFPLAVAFTDQSGGQRNAWSWNFGDGWSSSVQNPTHVYGTAGVFTVSLTASNPGGSNTVVKTGYITTTNPPIAVEVLRLRASAIGGVTNGGNVATWTAMAGPNATQTNVAKQPVWVSSGPDLPNGRPYVRFNRDPALENDPNGDFMRVAFAGDYPQPLTVFLVTRIRPVNSGNAFLFDDDTFMGDSVRFVMYQGGNSSNLRMFVGGSEFGFTDAALTNGWHVLEAAYSGAASTFSMDGTVKATGAVGAGGLQANRGLKIGSRYNDNGYYQLNGDIAEMVIYSGLLTPAARLDAGSRLATRYGLTTEYPPPPGTVFRFR